MKCEGWMVQLQPTGFPRTRLVACDQVIDERSGLCPYDDGFGGHVRQKDPPQDVAAVKEAE